MTLREGRADLHQRLTAAAYEGLTEEPDPVDPHGLAHWTRQELCELLAKAADMILTCPVEGCAYCWQVERKEQP